MFNLYSKVPNRKLRTISIGAKPAGRRGSKIREVRQSQVMTSAEYYIRPPTSQGLRSLLNDCLIFAPIGFWHVPIARPGFSSLYWHICDCQFRSYVHCQCHFNQFVSISLDLTFVHQTKITILTIKRTILSQSRRTIKFQITQV